MLNIKIIIQLFNIKTRKVLIYSLCKNVHFTWLTTEKRNCIEMPRFYFLHSNNTTSLYTTPTFLVPVVDFISRSAAWQRIQCFYTSAGGNNGRGSHNASLRREEVLNTSQTAGFMRKGVVWFFLQTQLERLLNWFERYSWVGYIEIEAHWTRTVAHN